MAYVLQDPDETLTHSIDWVDWLASGDSISSGSWAITPTGPTVTDLGESAAVSSARVSGLTRGQVYRLTNTVISADGETGERSVTIRCDHR